MTRMTSMAKCGVWCTSTANRFASTTATLHRLRATAPALRGPSSADASLPNMPPPAPGREDVPPEDDVDLTFDHRVHDVGRCTLGEDGLPGVVGSDVPFALEQLERGHKPRGAANSNARDSSSTDRLRAKAWKKART